MQAPSIAHEFLALIQKSSLLSEKQVRRAIEQFGLEDDMPPRTVARILVHHRVLTPFQAERLLEGRYRGFVIDCYRVREVLGVGGMGCVYIAEDLEHDRKVALKVLSSQHSLDPSMLARLKLEAAAGMQIRHPNVIETYRIDTTGAINFLVMELVRGISLHELAALQGPVAWPMVCDMFAQVARGLHAAHERRIIHRDVKPANVLIDSDGTAKLLDFGLAKVEENANEEFSLAMIFGHDCLGTPDYIAPEQAADSNEVGPAADIYSLGCTMYVALTARVPFPVKRASAKIEAHRAQSPRSILELQPHIPPDVVAIVEKMMAKDAADRYPSAAHVADALEPFASRKPVNFDFRKIITLRARQARKKEASQRRDVSGPRSSITSASAWIHNSSQQLEAEIDTLANNNDTPAIRQPAPRRERPTTAPALPPRPRNAPPNRLNVPRGWVLQRIGSQHKYAITRVKTRVGKSSDCEFFVGGDVDDRQCSIEFDSGTWRLKQESRSKPTFVNGKPQAHAELRHGSIITFADGSGMELVNTARPESRFSRPVVIAFLVALALLGAVSAWLMLR